MFCLCLISTFTPWVGLNFIYNSVLRWLHISEEEEEEKGEEDAHTKIQV